MAKLITHILNIFSGIGKQWNGIRFRFPTYVLVRVKSHQSCPTNHLRGSAAVPEGYGM